MPLNLVAATSPELPAAQSPAAAGHQVTTLAREKDRLATELSLEMKQRQALSSLAEGRWAPRRYSGWVGVDSVFTHPPPPPCRNQLVCFPGWHAHVGAVFFVGWHILAWQHFGMSARELAIVSEGKLSRWGGVGWGTL
jgi:hypothetical protein